MHEKLKELNETGNNPEKARKHKKTPVSPPGAGETTKGELCGSLTLLQDEITFLLEHLTFIWRDQSALQNFYDGKNQIRGSREHREGSWKGLNFKSSAAFPFVPVRSALKQQGIKCKR
jgi:hypothetical protein